MWGRNRSFSVYVDELVGVEIVRPMAIRANSSNSRGAWLDEPKMMSGKTVVGREVLVN